jgi:hypothetical protein
MTIEPDKASPATDDDLSDVCWPDFIEAVRRDDPAAMSTLQEYVEDYVAKHGMSPDDDEEETTPLRDAFRSVLPAGNTAIGRLQSCNAIADMLLEAVERKSRASS